MPTCQECKFYEAIDETKGNCFGYEMAADQDSEQCPARSFQPKK